MKEIPKELQLLITVPGHERSELSIEVTRSAEVAEAQNLWLSDVQILSKKCGNESFNAFGANGVVALATVLTYTNPNEAGSAIHILTQVYPRWTKLTSYIAVCDGNRTVFTEHSLWKHNKSGGQYDLQSASIDPTTGKLMIHYSPRGLGSTYLMWTKEASEFLSKFSILVR